MRLHEIINEMTLYHGSPHKFDKFDHAQMGTGEGSQAYGWGTYLAENPDVGANYVMSTAYKQPVSHSGVTEENGKYLAWVKMTDKESVEIIYTAPTKSEAQEKLKEYLDGKEGNLYEVDVPDDAIAKMLDWDLAMSKQPKAVKEAMKAAAELGDPVANKAYAAMIGATDAFDDWDGNRLYRELARRAVEEKRVKGKMGLTVASGQPEASEFLRWYGIPGIKYYDGGSRSAGKGTRNFVIFDANLITIISRNGVAV